MVSVSLLLTLITAKAIEAATASNNLRACNGYLTESAKADQTRVFYGISTLWQVWSNFTQYHNIKENRWVSVQNPKDTVIIQIASCSAVYGLATNGKVYTMNNAIWISMVNFPNWVPESYKFTTIACGNDGEHKNSLYGIFEGGTLIGKYYYHNGKWTEKRLAFKRNNGKDVVFKQDIGSIAVGDNHLYAITNYGKLATRRSGKMQVTKFTATYVAAREHHLYWIERTSRLYRATGHNLHSVWDLGGIDAITIGIDQVYIFSRIFKPKMIYSYPNQCPLFTNKGFTQLGGDCTGAPKSCAGGRMCYNYSINLNSKPYNFNRCLERKPNVKEKLLNKGKLQKRLIGEIAVALVSLAIPELAVYEGAEAIFGFFLVESGGDELIYWANYNGEDIGEILPIAWRNGVAQTIDGEAHEFTFEHLEEIRRVVRGIPRSAPE